MISAGNIPLHPQVSRGGMAAGGLQQGKDLHMIASVVAVVGWEPMGAAGQEAYDEQKDT